MDSVTELVSVCILYGILPSLQGVQEDFDDVVIAVGSGGSAAGLAIANHLTGSKLK